MTDQSAPGCGDYPIKCRLRLDYRGEARPPRFIFGGVEAEDVARQEREQRINWWKNVPQTGLRIESVEPGEIYYLQEETEEGPVAFAPLELYCRVYSPEDLLPVVCSPFFRSLEILEPLSFSFTHWEMERLLCRLKDFAS